MATYMLICLLGKFGESEWETYLDVYRIVPEKLVVIGPDNNFYLLNRVEATIHIIDKNGVNKSVFAGIGEAPGKVPYPILYEIYFFENELYFSTKAKTLVYKPGGEYVRQWRVKKLGSKMRRVRNGWIVYDIEEGGSHIGPATVKWVDENLGNEKLLLTWERTKDQSSNLIIRDVGMIEFTRDGGRMFVRKPFSRSVVIYDTKTLKEVGVIHKEKPKVPISEERAAKMRKTEKGKRAIPDYYPNIYKLSWLNTTFVISYFIENLRLNWLFFDKFGKEKTPIYSMGLMSTIIALEDDSAWLCLFDHKEDQAVMVKWASQGLQEHFDQWLKEHYVSPIAP